MSENYGLYAQSLSNKKRHLVLKITAPQTNIKCHKVFTFHPQDRQGISLFQNHFEDVREWLRMRYSGRSLLHIRLKIDLTISKQANSNKTELKVITDFNHQLTLQAFYQKLSNTRSMSTTIQDYMHYFVQMFQAILRGGSITNFFYTPHNLFFSRSAIKDEVVKFSVNYSSAVGLDFLYLQRDILKEDLFEIFPLLPNQLQRVSNINNVEKYRCQLNRIIKMKAFLWNIFCFIIKEVPNILFRESQNQQKSFTFQAVQGLLRKYHSENTMNELIENYRQTILKAQKVTSIDFMRIFRKVLVNNCIDVSWTEIYQEIFLQNKTTLFKTSSSTSLDKASPDDPTEDNHADIESFKISYQILKSVWERQQYEVKQFYRKRSIPPHSMVYFLIRCNRDFRNMMEHLNILQFLNKANFSSSLHRVHLDFMEASIREIQNFNSRDYIMPYSQVLVPPPFSRTESEQFMFMRMSNAQSMIMSLSRNIQQRQGKRPVHIIHYQAQALVQLASRLHY